MRIIDIYNKFIRYAGLVVEDDKVYIPISGSREPYLVGGKHLVIPSSKILRGFDASSMIVFHPLSEDIIKGESNIINKLRYTINIKINIAIGVLVQSLLNLVDSPEYHKKLSPEQMELLYKISELDDKTVKSFISFMIKEVNEKEDRLFSYIYLKRAGVLSGVKYARVAVTSFPFYQSLIKGDKYKFRTKDLDSYKAIFQFIFPEIDEPEAYSYGSNSDVAPFLEALMFSSYKITQRINELTDMYKEYIDNSDSIMFDNDWYDDLTDINALKNEIRSIPSITTEAIQEQTVSTPQQPQYPQYQQQVAQPMPPQPVLKETSRGLDFNSLKQKLGIQQIPSAFVMQGAMPMMNAPAPYIGDILNRQIPQQPMGYPQQGMMYPQQPMQPQQPMGFPQQPMGFPQQGMMYPQQPMGFPQQGMMYPQQPMGFPQQGMMGQPMGYPQQPPPFVQR